MALLVIPLHIVLQVQLGIIFQCAVYFFKHDFDLRVVRFWRQPPEEIHQKVQEKLPPSSA
jgi:hypothetical protein